MPSPSQSSAFPTFLQYWKNLIQPARRTVPVIQSRTTAKNFKRSMASSITLEGELSISESGCYSVDGNDFVIDANTFVFGELKIGMRARVVCSVDGDRKRAIKIVIS